MLQTMRVDTWLFIAERYGAFRQRNTGLRHNYILYADQYTYEFENYCLENGLGERCNEGILLNEDVAFVACAAVAVEVHSFKNICAAEVGTLDFWGNVGISLDTTKQPCYEVRAYATRIESNRQARKYLTRLKQLRAQLL